jgi:hypothetical protein
LWRWRLPEIDYSSFRQQWKLFSAASGVGTGYTLEFAQKWTKFYLLRMIAVLISCNRNRQVFREPTPKG